MKPYPADLRERVLADCDGGLTTRAAAAQYRVSESWVRRPEQARRGAGRTAPAAQRRGADARLGGPRRRHPGGRRGGPGRDPGRVPPAVRPAAVPVGPRPGARRPRAVAGRRPARASEQDRPGVAAARAAWRAGQPELGPDRRVLVGETWASTSMARTRGRCPPGRRLVTGVPHGHWKATTFVAALRAGGVTAPVAIGGAVTCSWRTSSGTWCRRCDRGTWW